jgi:hypothetical protein
MEFRDIAAAMGVVARNRYGGVHTKRWILEMTGNGVAILDVDNDDRPDILFPDGKAPILYPNRGGGQV